MDEKHTLNTIRVLVDKVDMLQASVDALSSRLAAACGAPSPTTPPPRPRVEFSLLRDLGIIQVPEGYAPDTYMSSFRERHRPDFVSMFKQQADTFLTEHATRILRAGERFRVRIFAQDHGEMTTSEERVAFLQGHGAVYLGACGLMLLWEQKRDVLPRNMWHTSFEGSVKCINVAGIRRDGGDQNFFSQASLYDRWTEDYALVCFTDASA